MEDRDGTKSVQWLKENIQSVEDSFFKHQFVPKTTQGDNSCFGILFNWGDTKRPEAGPDSDIRLDSFIGSDFFDNLKIAQRFIAYEMEGRKMLDFKVQRGP